MERLYYIAKDHITRFKLDYCCWFAPVRVGLMFIGCLHIFIDIICILGIANDGFSPTITRVMEMLIEDNVSKPVPVLAYCTEVAFNVVLLCAVYRRDIILLRVFLYYTFLAVIMSIMIYSIVISAVPFHIQVAIITSIIFQAYSILIIRSVMVEFKMQGKKYELPRIVMSNLLSSKEVPCIYDPNNGKLKEVVISEIHKKPELQITVIKDEDTKELKVPEFKPPEFKKVNLDKVQQKIEEDKEPEIKVQIETKYSKKNGDNGEVLKNKEEIKVDEEKKKEKSEDKKQQEKSVEDQQNDKSEDDKKKQDKKSEEERKKEEKRLKEEKKKEEKKLREEKKREEKKVKEEKKKDDRKLTSLILKKYKEDKEATKESKENEQKKELKEVSLQTVTENPNE